MEYNRYEQAALLEDKADETSTMTSAISKLKGLQEFGLSMLSGLGWLTGPDISDRVKLFKPKPVVFGPQYQLPDRELREAQEQWEELVEDQTRSSKRISNKKDRCFFRTRTEYLPATGMPKVVFNNNVFTNAGIRPPIMFGNINMEAREPSQLDNEDEGDGTDVAHLPWNPIAARTWSTAFEFSLALQDDPEQIRPNLLTPEQEEWLMEMQWAQGAFLSSWCIAVLDNPGVFRGLRTFNIANLSSGLLEWLQRDDVWRAMPSLENLTLLVSPDWRQVGMNRQGEIETEIICASTAQEPFYNFLSALFAWNTSIKTLHIGYVGGGENAPGMFARNQNIIPAPIMRFSNTILLDVDNTLDLRHVEHLTLSNCWLTPKATKMFFRDMTHSNLQTVAFNSVSLTADVRSGAINVAARLHVQGPRGGPLGRDHAFIVTLRNKWLLHDPRPGSWPDVIDSITPGHGIRRVRWFHGSPDIDNKPPLPAPTSLTSISFTSCGYVRLVNLFESDFDQSAIPQTIQEAPLCLKKRHAKLGEVMMESNFDGFLGTIVPALTPEDEGCLRAVWGMKMGWGEERKSEKWDVREDGMGEGGLGRFRGMVQREEEEEG